MTTKYQSGARVSEYVLEECVGAGTFGEVWQARHHVWENERVAVKLPTEPEYVRYLQREGSRRSRDPAPQYHPGHRGWTRTARRRI